MKRFLPILSIAFLAACNSKPDTSMVAEATGSSQLQTSSSYTDTTGLAQFQAWKVQNELADVNEYNQTEQASITPVAKPKSTVRKQSAPARKQTTAPVASRQTKNASQSTSGSVENNSDGEGTSTESGEIAKAPQKKGISKAAKGAVIGGAGGAIAGAVINKNNRVVGAVIGGVVGAGGGYVIGRKMDKKDGRL